MFCRSIRENTAHEPGDRPATVTGIAEGDARQMVCVPAVFLFPFTGCFHWLIEAEFGSVRSLHFLIRYCAFSTLVAGYVLAEDTLIPPTIVVTAPPIAADDIDTEFQSGRVSVIDRSEFDGDVATVADVLKRETGVQIRSLGGLGSFSTVNVRGASSSQVNIYLDGILLNGAYGGTVDLSQILLSSVEQIEVYRGNVPVQLGKSGIGGAINIKTRRSQDEPKRQVSVSAGSFDTQKLSGVLNQGFDHGSVLFSAEYLRSDNDFPFRNNNLTPENPNDDFDERRNNAGIEQLAGILSGEYRFSELWSVNYALQVSDKDQGIPEASNSADSSASLSTEFALAHLKLNHNFNSNTRFSYSIYGSEKQELFDDSESRIDVDRDREKATTDTGGLSFQASHGIGSHLYNVNFEWQQQQLDLEDLLSSDGTGEFDRSEILFAIQDEWLNGSGEVMINGAVRYVYVDDQYDYLDQSLNEINDSNSDHYYSVQTCILWMLSDQWQLRSNLSRDIRIPELDEKFGDRGVFQGNEELVEETAINFDLGARYQDESLDASITYFFRDLDNGIVINYNSRGVGQAENIDQARIHGLELELQYEFTDALQLIYKSTSQNSENLSNNADRRGKPLSGLYEFSAYLAPEFKHQNFKYRAEFIYQSGGNYDSAGEAPMPDFNQVNLIMAWAGKTRGLEVNLENVGDQQVEYFNRFPGPGRRIYITYKQQF